MDNIEDITLSEISQTEKNKYHMIPYMGNPKKQKTKQNKIKTDPNVQR